MDSTATPVSRPRRLTRTLTVFALSALAALGLSAAASALPPIGNPPPPPPPPVTKPNLVISDAAVTAIGTAQWEVRYTVKNNGPIGSLGFSVDAHQDGWGLLKSSSQVGLGAGASRTEVMTFPRNANCYLAVRFTADSKSVIVESSEADNVRWAVGHTGPTCATLPRYTVKAVSFHAVDETGADWLGSDEPYWIFNGVGAPGTERSTASRVFGDVDTGDTVSFGSTEGCLYLSCAGGAAPNGMGFSIAVWEKDLGYVSQTLTNYANFFKSIGGVTDPYAGPIAWLGSALVKVGDALDYINSWAADDLVGSQTYAYSATTLASRLPAAGQSFTDTRTYTGGGGTYTMTTLVTRVA
jgi:hypothetical protein